MNVFSEQLFHEFGEDQFFHGDAKIVPTLKDDYHSALNEHLNQFIYGHIQYGGYHASPSHCQRYLDEIWEAGEYAIEKHVQNDRFGSLPEESYDCFATESRFGKERRWGFNYFSELFAHIKSRRGVPLLDLYMTPIQRSYKNVRENLNKFRRIAVEMVAITILLISMMLYGTFFLTKSGVNAVASNGLINTKFFLYLLILFIVVPVLIYFQDAHKNDSSPFRIFYHPGVMTIITLLCILSAVFGLQIFGIVNWITNLTFWIPLLFYLIYYILDAVHLYSEVQKIKYQQVWRQEYAIVFKEEYEKPLRYIQFRILWWKSLHKTLLLPFPFVLMKLHFYKYYLMYRWCLNHCNYNEPDETEEN